MPISRLARWHPRAPPAAIKTYSPNAKQATGQADALLARFMAVADDASLAQHAREVLAGNRRKAVNPTT